MSSYLFVDPTIPAIEEADLRKTPPAPVCGHRYHPWCYIITHSSYQSAASVEASHFASIADASIT